MGQAPTVRLELRPVLPFRLDLTVWALRRRERNLIDRWDGRVYRRMLPLGDEAVEVSVRQTGRAERPALAVELAGPRPRAAEEPVRAALTRALGVDIDLSSFYARASRERLLSSLAERYRGLKPPRFPTLFECLLNAVACQQLSLDAGLELLNRLAGAADPRSREAHPFPQPADVLRLEPADLRRVGFSGRKADTILALAEAAAAGELDATALERADDDVVRAELTKRPGIGPWSADYLMLRGLGRLHVFPRHDIGALNGLRRFLADNGAGDEAEGALARWSQDAGLVYFHLLLRGLERRGTIETSAGDTG